MQIKIFLQYPRCTHEIFIFELRRAMQYQLRDLFFFLFSTILLIFVRNSLNIRNKILFHSLKNKNSTNRKGIAI